MRFTNENQWMNELWFELFQKLTILEKKILKYEFLICVKFKFSVSEGLIYEQDMRQKKKYFSDSWKNLNSLNWSKRDKIF